MLLHCQNEWKSNVDLFTESPSTRELKQNQNVLVAHNEDNVTTKWSQYTSRHPHEKIQWRWMSVLICQFVLTTLSQHPWGRGVGGGGGSSNTPQPTQPHNCSPVDSPSPRTKDTIGAAGDNRLTWPLLVKVVLSNRK